MGNKIRINKSPNPSKYLKNENILSGKHKKAEKVFKKSSIKYIKGKMTKEEFVKRLKPYSKELNELGHSAFIGALDQ